MRLLSLLSLSILFLTCKQNSLSVADHKILSVSDSLMIQQKKLHDEWHFSRISSVYKRLSMFGDEAGWREFEKLKNTWDKYEQTSEWLASMESDIPNDTLVSLTLFSDALNFVSKEFVEEHSLKQPFQKASTYPYRSNAQMNLAFEEHYNIILDIMRSRYMYSDKGDWMGLLSASKDDVTRIYFKVNSLYPYLERIIIPESYKDNFWTLDPPVWVPIQYKDDNHYIIEYRNERGQRMTKKFEETLKVDIIYYAIH